LLRMQTLLVRVAGLEYLESTGTQQQREALAALERCEEIELPRRELPAPGVRAAKEFPRYDDEVAAVRSSLPAWMGIQFRAPSEELVQRHNLLPGAAAVITVYPNSPAEAAGLRQGDIVLGPPGSPFDERGQVRSWIMMARVGEPLLLEILRGNRKETLRLVPASYPLRWPSLPGPPKVGEIAPPIDLVPYRGDVPRQLGGGQPYVLFFWATWCAPCKASLPEIAAFEAQKQTPVVAITDESKSHVDRFFQTYTGPFPSRIATDEFRKAFVAFGVSGTPTFVLVDGDGRVRAVHAGYDATRGLPFEGWVWRR
jgi:thiol-disulfide isomerase/thioredoxin